METSQSAVSNKLVCDQLSCVCLTSPQTEAIYSRTWTGVIWRSSLPDLLNPSIQEKLNMELLLLNIDRSQLRGVLASG